MQQNGNRQTLEKSSRVGDSQIDMEEGKNALRRWNVRNQHRAQKPKRSLRAAHRPAILHHLTELLEQRFITPWIERGLALNSSLPDERSETDFIRPTQHGRGSCPTIRHGVTTERLLVLCVYPHSTVCESPWWLSSLSLRVRQSSQRFDLENRLIASQRVFPEPIRNRTYCVTRPFKAPPRSSSRPRPAISFEAQRLTPSFIRLGSLA